MNINIKFIVKGDLAKNYELKKKEKKIEGGIISTLYLNKRGYRAPQDQKSERLNQQPEFIKGLIEVELKSEKKCTQPIFNYYRFGESYSISVMIKELKDVYVI